MLMHSLIERDRVLIVDPSTPSHARLTPTGGDDDRGVRTNFDVGAGAGGGGGDTFVLSIAVPAYGRGKDATESSDGLAKSNGGCEARPRPSTDDARRVENGGGGGSAIAGGAAADKVDDDRERRRRRRDGKCGACLVV